MATHSSILTWEIPWTEIIVHSDAKCLAQCLAQKHSVNSSCKYCLISYLNPIMAKIMRPLAIDK